MTDHPPLRQRDIARFYLPLLLNVQLMSVSHTVINGALARGSEPLTAIAAFGVALALHLFIASFAFQNHTVTLALVQDRATLLHVCRFAAGIALAVMLLVALLGFTALGERVFRGLLGVDAPVARGAQEALQVLVLLPLFSGARGIAQGLLMRARRTGLVSAATGVRIGALAVILALASPWLDGPRLGAVALVGCIAVETLFTVAFATRCRLPWSAAGTELTATTVLRFGLPLALASSLQMTLPLLLSAILSRFPDGTAALAGFGVVRGFLFLLAGPQNNLQQAYLALVHSAADQRQLLRFNLIAGGMLALLMLLLAGPLSGRVLGDWMGLDAGLRHYITLPLVLCALFPVSVGLTYQLAGRFTRADRTGTLGRAVLLKIGWLGLFWLGTVIAGASPPWPGLLVGLVLFLCAQWLELAWLWRSRPPSPA